MNDEDMPGEALYVPSTFTFDLWKFPLYREALEEAGFTYSAYMLEGGDHVGCVILSREEDIDRLALLAAATAERCAEIRREGEELL